MDGPRRSPEHVDPEVRALVHEMTRRSFELQLPVWEDVEEAVLDPPAASGWARSRARHS